MCGIAGVFGESANDQAQTEAMAQALKQLATRGPDGMGMWESPHVLLGHRRLAILDPRDGHQPWIDRRTGVVLVYNGELFNYRQLRGELEAKGHTFRSSCDSEAVALSYVEWGPTCLRRWIGMFALAIYDPRDGSLWLARDRLGIKPLFYHWDDINLRFASNVAALLCFPGVSRRMDTAAMCHYLASVRVSLGERTLIQGIHLLPPGHELQMVEGAEGPQLKRWWCPPVVPENDKPSIDFQEASDWLRGSFPETAKSHLLSDVPVGGFLSGGLDSSVLAASALAANGHPPLEAYSTGYLRGGYGEWPFVREVAQRNGIELTEVPLEEASFLEDWKGLIAANGLPLSTPNEVPIFRLASEFAQRFKVALTGEGADEIFGGYAGPTFSALDFDRSRGDLGGMDAAALLRGYGRTRFSDRCDHFRQVNSWLGRAARRSLMASDLRPAAAEHEVDEYYRELFRLLETCSTLEAYLHVHTRINLEGLLLRLDSSTMAASVEGRVPFCDHSVAEMLFQLPDSFKMRLRPEAAASEVSRQNAFEIMGNGMVETKRLLRDSFSGAVPTRVLQRPKMSFPVPFIEWFQDSLRPTWTAYLQESTLLTALLSPSARNRLIQQPVVDALAAWPLMNLAMWAERWDIQVS